MIDTATAKDRLGTLAGNLLNTVEMALVQQDVMQHNEILPMPRERAEALWEDSPSARMFDELIEFVEHVQAILEDISDPDPCQYDHHDLCQAHSLHKRPCPHARAKEMVG